MIPILLAAILAGLAFWLLTQILWSRKPVSGLSNRIVLLAAALIGGVLVLVASGRLHWIAGVLAAVFPFLRRGFMLLQLAPFLARLFGSARSPPHMAGAAGTHGASSPSESRTSELHMRLDRETGNIDGTVLAGEFQGMQLGALDEVQALRLYRSLQEPDSRRLFEVFLDRYHPNLRRQDAGARGNPEGSAHASMSEHRAREILGLDSDASREDIVASHRRLMQRLHPDKGGSDFLAAQLNLAKKTLLKG